MEPSTNGIKSWQWVVTVVIIIVLVILGYYMFKGSSNNKETTNTEETSNTSSTTNGAVNRMVISDQFPGNIVYISSVQIDQPGFIAIHKDKNGTPGDIIGSQYFDKGINPGKITLTSPTVEGGIYYAMLHLDDGDKKFDAKKDLPLKDTSGNIIMKIFHAASNITEIKG